MTVECPGQITGYDDMKQRLLTGSSDWHQVSVVLDVPANAIGITITAMLNGGGTLRIDDARLDVVGTDVPTTNTLATPQLTGQDSTAIAAAYARGGSVPTNLDFEGFAPPAQSAVDWLSRTASLLTTTDPTASLADLQPLKQMVGTAHLVGLGEGTHGTREFFQMKHRLLQTLVRDMGFTVFAIEASAPEANDLNRYVLTGQGDPHILLSRLYFWTWNTQEVFDMVQWMRQWNTTAPAAQRVQFLGFDMQFPGEAMDSVQSFVTRVHQPDSAYVATRFYCMNPYRNRGERSPDLTAAFYAERVAASERAGCAQGLQEVYNLIADDIQKYPNAAPADTFQLRLHDARLIQQYEQKIAVEGVSSSAVRDRAMAENVVWIRNQVGPNGKVVLWAHDGHINNTAGYMGGYLRAAYGSDYISLGFAFAEGSFNAVGFNGEGLKSWHTAAVPSNSIEAFFSATNKSALLFDARQIASGGASAAPLAGPLPMRSIGSAFNAAAEASFFGPVTFPGTFDLLVYLKSTTASTLLPFVFK
jgi:erythromycin esterase